MNAWWPRERRQWLALIVGIVALVVCLWLGLIGSARQTMLSYLFAFVFFCGLSVGSLAFLMVHAVTGGEWGEQVRPALLAAARVLPLVALLALPIVLDIHALYTWSHVSELAHDDQLRKQTWYLNPTFFIIRTVGYFVVWGLLLAFFSRRLAHPKKLQHLAAPGLIVFALTSLLAGTDWTMSLLPHWTSTTYGMMFATGWMLAALALATLAVIARADAGDELPPRVLHDLGNLLLVLVLGWSYLAFMQYLTIWIADLPAENIWYLPRTRTSWAWLGRFLIVFEFVVPFVILLSHSAKRSRRWMRWVAGLLLVGNLADALWLVLPNFREAGFALRWTDLCAVVGIGGLWCCAWLGQLRVARAAQPEANRDAAWRASHG